VEQSLEVGNLATVWPVNRFGGERGARAIGLNGERASVAVTRHGYW
jgi:hypothetical protein